MDATAPLSPGDLLPSFYMQEYETVRTFIEKSRSRPGQHLAIVGESLSCREELLQRIVREYKEEITPVSFSHPVDREYPFAGQLQDSSILVIGNAQYLASRTIGGFSSLRAFISLVAERKQTIISSWNIHAWDYYAAAVNLDKACSRTVLLPPVPMELLREAILSHYQHSVTCTNDATLQKSVFISSNPRTVRVPFIGNEVNIPSVTVDWNLIASVFKKKKDELSPEDVVFSRLHELSGGNLETAIALWNQGFRYPEIRVSGIRELPVLPALSFDERYILVNLLMMESLEAEEIARVSKSTTTQQDLFRLTNENVLEAANGQFRISSLMTRPVLAYLQGHRMVS